MFNNILQNSTNWVTETWLWLCKVTQKAIATIGLDLDNVKMVKQFLIIPYCCVILNLQQKPGAWDSNISFGIFICM